MVQDSAVCIGLDTAKPRNAVAIAAPGRDRDVRCLREFKNSGAMRAKPVRKPARRRQA
jgi:hypothetical protein